MMVKNYVILNLHIHIFLTSYPAPFRVHVFGNENINSARNVVVLEIHDFASNPEVKSK